MPLRSSWRRVLQPSPHSSCPVPWETVVLFSSAPDICTASALALCRGWTYWCWLLSQTLLGKVGAGQCCSWMLKPVWGGTSCSLLTFLLPSPNPAPSRGPIHIFLKVPQHSSFPPSPYCLFPLAELYASEALVEAEWSGSLYLLPNLSFPPWILALLFSCMDAPLIYFYEPETGKLNEILGMKSTRLLIKILLYSVSPTSFVVYWRIKSIWGRACLHLALAKIP